MPAGWMSKSTYKLRSSIGSRIASIPVASPDSRSETLTGSRLLRSSRVTIIVPRPRSESSAILPIRSAIIIFTQYRSLACSRWARARTRSQLRRTSSGSMANQEISSPSLAGERRFAVEAFRTLAELSPTDVVATVSNDLDQIADFELTPILESISQRESSLNLFSHRRRSNRP